MMPIEVGASQVLGHPVLQSEGGGVAEREAHSEGTSGHVKMEDNRAWKCSLVKRTLGVLGAHLHHVESRHLGESRHSACTPERLGR